MKSILKTVAFIAIMSLTLLSCSTDDTKEEIYKPEVQMRTTQLELDMFLFDGQNWLLTEDEGHSYDVIPLGNVKWHCKTGELGTGNYGSANITVNGLKMTVFWYAEYTEAPDGNSISMPLPDHSYSFKIGDYNYGLEFGHHALC